VKAPTSTVSLRSGKKKRKKRRKMNNAAPQPHSSRPAQVQYAEGIAKLQEVHIRRASAFAIMSMQHRANSAPGTTSPHLTDSTHAIAPTSREGNTSPAASTRSASPAAATSQYATPDMTPTASIDRISNSIATTAASLNEASLEASNHAPPNIRPHPPDLRPLPHPNPGKDLYTSMRDPERRAALALRVLDGCRPLSFAYEHALWGIVLKSRASTFALERSDASFTRLDVAIFYYLLFPMLRPMRAVEKEGKSVRCARISVSPTQEIQTDLYYCPLQVQLPPGLPETRGEPGVLNVLCDQSNPRVESFYGVRDPRYDAAPPQLDSFARLCVLLAAKNVRSISLPIVGGDSVDATWTITSLELLPRDPGPVVDSHLKPRDASLVLTRLATFSNDENKSELAVALCQLALARWPTSAVSWVALHHALRRLNAAVRMPCMHEELFNPADCYLEAVKHDHATAAATPGTTRREVEIARKSLDLTSRHFVDVQPVSGIFALRTKLVVFGVLALASSIWARQAARNSAR
jgi:hypothetical protein